MSINAEFLEQGPRALDHYIVQVKDLDAARATYQRLGFQVLPRMKHLDVGSSNCVAQFENTYLELLGDLDKAPPELMAEYLPRFECGEGLSHISLRSFDMKGDHAEAGRLGLNPRSPLNARRPVVMPDGTVEETDSHSFYMWRPKRLYLSLFLSVHFRPEIVWVPEYQQHPNTAIDTIGVVFVSDDPRLDREYFSTLYKSAPTIEKEDEVWFTGLRGDTAEIYTSDRIKSRYPSLDLEICDKQPGYPVGLKYQVGSLSTCQKILRRNGVKFTVDGETLVIPPDEANGAVIEFVAH